MAVSDVACEGGQVCPQEPSHAQRKRAAIERGKAAYLEIYANLQQGKTYFSITTKEGVERVSEVSPIVMLN